MTAGGGDSAGGQWKSAAAPSAHFPTFQPSPPPGGQTALSGNISSEDYRREFRSRPSGYKCTGKLRPDINKSVFALMNAGRDGQP